MGGGADIRICEHGAQFAGVGDGAAIQVLSCPDVSCRVVSCRVMPHCVASNCVLLLTSLL